MVSRSLEERERQRSYRCRQQRARTVLYEQNSGGKNQTLYITTAFHGESGYKMETKQTADTKMSRQNVRTAHAVVSGSTAAQERPERQKRKNARQRCLHFVWEDVCSGGGCDRKAAVCSANESAKP